MLDSLSGSDSLVGVHLKELLHQINLFFVHDRCVSCLYRFWMRDFWELETLVSRIPTKFILKKVWQRSQNFLNYEKLVYFGVTGKERLAVHELPHYTTYSPDIHLFAIGHII